MTLDTVSALRYVCGKSMAKPSDVLIYLTGGTHWIGGVQYTRNLLSAVSLLPASERPRLVVQIGKLNRKQGYEEEFSRLPGVAIDGPVQPSKWDLWKHRLFGSMLPSGKLSQQCRVA